MASTPVMLPAAVSNKVGLLAIAVAFSAAACWGPMCLAYSKANRFSSTVQFTVLYFLDEPSFSAKHTV